MAPKEVSKKRKAAAPSAATPAKKSKTSRKPVAALTVDDLKPAPVFTESPGEDEQIPSEAPGDVSESEDDQTEALLKGFESSSDDEDNEDDSNISTSQEITSIPSIPTSVTLQKKLAAANNPSNAPGVIYIGRIPHGFFEHQMRSYFSQFGSITRLRLSRNRRTAASKHYAFLEFASSEVARIVADTMDNYLMFGHILKVKVLEPGSVHRDLWKGSERRFRKVPWNRIERSRLASSDREGWEKRVKAEEKRRVDKAVKLKALGYEYEAPKLREVEDVPVQVKAVAQAEAPKAWEDKKAVDSVVEQLPTMALADNTANGPSESLEAVPDSASKATEKEFKKNAKGVAKAGKSAKN